MARTWTWNRCAGAVRDAKRIDTAVLHGWKFALDEVGYATVVPAAGASVPGLLWMLSDADEAELDVYEGVRYNCYEKVTLSIVPKRTSVPTQALVYVSLREAKRGRAGTGLSGADRSCGGARRLRRVLPRDAQGSLGRLCECR